MSWTLEIHTILKLFLYFSIIPKMGWDWSGHDTIRDLLFFIFSSLEGIIELIPAPLYSISLSHPCYGLYSIRVTQTCTQLASHSREKFQFIPIFDTQIITSIYSLFSQNYVCWTLVRWSVKHQHGHGDLHNHCVQFHNIHV